MWRLTVLAATMLMGCVWIPLFDEVGGLNTRADSLTGERRCVEQQPDSARLRMACLMARKISKMLSDFDSIAP